MERTLTRNISQIFLSVAIPGGAAYSSDTVPWPWLTSQSAAEAMAAQVSISPAFYVQLL